MASREELHIIRAARAGQAAAQLALGKRYLFGGAGLPKNSATALHWLDRAAQQHEQSAWMLIGSHIPFEIALQSTQSEELCIWYERAFDAGQMQAGLVFARLVMARNDAALDKSLRCKAMRALKAAASAGIAEAQWLLAQQMEKAKTATLPIPSDQKAAGCEAPRNSLDAPMEAKFAWTTQAANGGVVQAQHALAEQAWVAGDHANFLRWALPLARDLSFSLTSGKELSGEGVILLSRCAQALSLAVERSGTKEIEKFWVLAAEAGDKNAQFSLGLWLAKMDESGTRIASVSGSANYKKSIRWLTLAAEQGVTAAWYAMSRIYLKAEFSQRNLADAQRYLERAAEAGHCAAQLEAGAIAWRNRRDASLNDVRAVFWLQKASAQGNVDARILLGKIAASANSVPWAKAAQRQLTREFASLYPFLAARIELAALFGLSRAEALSIDLKSADYGHCLLVDIGAQHARSKRRLILIETSDAREALDRIVRLFENVDCGSSGPEGNYRQRFYRLKSLGAEKPESKKTASQISISPSKTLTAGPVSITGKFCPVHVIDRLPPCVSTFTGESNRPRRMPATTAAQAPVPQASVSPAPRSNTRSLI